MLPSIWGPHFWFILHVISFAYPEHPTEYDKRIYHDFYTSLKDVIPCELCRKHYREHILKYPLTPHLDTRETFINWVIQVHNFVNTSLNKPTLTVKEVKEIYKDLNPISPFILVDTQKIIDRHREKDLYRLYFWIILCSIIILVIRYYFNKYYFSY